MAESELSFPKHTAEQRASVGALGKISFDSQSIHIKHIFWHFYTVTFFAAPWKSAWILRKIIFNTRNSRLFKKNKWGRFVHVRTGCYNPKFPHNVWNSTGIGIGIGNKFWFLKERFPDEKTLVEQVKASLMIEERAAIVRKYYDTREKFDILEARIKQEKLSVQKSCEELDSLKEIIKQIRTEKLNHNL